METLYQKYAAEFELNADREEVLKKICKASLKMDECLDVGDLSGAKNLSAMLDQLRKSGKFTEAQNKEDKKQELDSIGELVKLCEAHAGPIRPEIDPYDTPQDKIDFTIRDIQSYLYNLVTKEHGLGNLIESYIQKLEKKEQLEAEEAEKNKLMDSFITSREEEAEKNAPLSDEEAEEFQQAMMQMREEDAIQAEAEELVNYFGGK